MIECARYRIVPTEEEYKKMYPDLTETYNEWGNVVLQGMREPMIAFPQYSNSLEEFWGYNPQVVAPTKPPMAVYDNRNKGWVLCSIQLDDLSEEARESLWITAGDYEIYKQVVIEVVKKFPKFVMPSNFAVSRSVVGKSKIYLDSNTSNNVRPATWTDTISGMPRLGWLVMGATAFLNYKLFAVISERVRLMLPIMRYEMSKFLIKNKIFTENNSTLDLSNLINALSQLRNGNHIDTTSMMMSSNTPEIISGETPLEVLNKYMSSIFKTETHREDDYTSVYSHFEDVFDELVNKVAYSCFIPCN